MAIRTNATAVLSLFDLTEDEVDVIIDADTADAYIEAASSIIDDVCLESGYSDAKLELIERWLSAHFLAAIIERRGKSEAVTGVAGVSTTYEGLTQMGFDYTPYGQHAKLLDTEGNLAALEETQQKAGKVFRATMLHIGGPDRRGEPECEL